MKTKTELDLLRDIEDFASEHPNKRYWIDLFSDNKAQYVAWCNKTFTCQQSEPIEVTEMSRIQIDRMRKLYPDHQFYRGLVNWYPERGIFEVMCSASTYTFKDCTEFYSTPVYFDMSGNEIYGDVAS